LASPPAPSSTAAPERLLVTTCKLGLGQTLSWASAFYLPAILAGAMAHSLGTRVPIIFAAFSVALLVVAATGPVAGRLIDRIGGRPVLMATNVLFAIGLVLLSQVQHTWQLFAVWLLLGVAMGSGLYEAAFATVVRLHGQTARKAIVGITLFGGFASTVSWPVTTWLLHEVGWRNACLFWAGVQVLLLLPLHASLPRLPGLPNSPNPPSSSPATSASAAPAASPAAAGGSAHASASSAANVSAISTRSFVRQNWPTLALMALCFCCVYFIGTSMMSHLPRLFMVSGATAAAAVVAAALVGPAQVIGRIADYSFLREAHPLWSARIAIFAYPVAALVLASLGSAGSWAYGVIFGLGNGIMTVAVGTLPLAMFGAQGYGQRQGLLMVPARIAQASAPFVFGLALERWQLGALWLVAGAATTAGIALWCLKPRQPADPVASPSPS
jgi:MFS family permease